VLVIILFAVVDDFDDNPEDDGPGSDRSTASALVVRS
jgi:hypothetical protein